MSDTEIKLSTTEYVENNFLPATKNGTLYIIGPTISEIKTDRYCDADGKVFISRPSHDNYVEVFHPNHCVFIRGPITFNEAIYLKAGSESLYLNAENIRKIKQACGI